MEIVFFAIGPQISKISEELNSANTSLREEEFDTLEEQNDEFLDWFIKLIPMEIDITVILNKPIKNYFFIIL